MKKNTFTKILLFAVVFTASLSCKKTDSNGNNTLTSDNMQMSINGTGFIFTGAATMNDISRGSTSSATILLTAYKKGGNPNNPEFGITLRGVHYEVGKTVYMTADSFGDHILLTQNNEDYDSYNAPGTTQSGVVTIEAVGNKLKCTFSGKLYNADGDLIEITDGQFEVPLAHF
jgi:hypothetical protein